jgi:lysozyme family protein
MAHDDNATPRRSSTVDTRTSTTKSDLLAALPGALVTSWVGDIDGAFSPMSGCLDDAR